MPYAAALHANNSFRVCSRGGCCGEATRRNGRRLECEPPRGRPSSALVLPTRSTGVAETAALGAVPAAPGHRTRDDNDEWRTSPIFINQSQSNELDGWFHFSSSAAPTCGVSVGLDHLVDVDQRCTERASESMLTHRVHASTQISEGKTGPNQSLFFAVFPRTQRRSQLLSSVSPKYLVIKCGDQRKKTVW